jgi:trimeric autotransporter adhesin
MKHRTGYIFVTFLSVVSLLAIACAAQTAGSNAASAQVPPVIQFSNVASDAGGNPLTGATAITFSLYNNSQGGEALWSETQNVTLGSSGQYSVYLGITKANGLPSTLFTSGQAHWLGVQIAGQAEQPRVFLVSVPYAMKAGDAATVGGLPPSAFVLAAPGNESSFTVWHTSVRSNSAISAAVSGTGKTDYIPLWTNSTGALGDSVLFQSGTNIGINNTKPAATLDVNGAVNTSTGFNLGGNAFAFGSLFDTNAFFGFAGNATMLGVHNTAVGAGALDSNTTGIDNTASGTNALESNTTGGGNTASGGTSLFYNTTGSGNTASGAFSGTNVAGGPMTGSNDTFLGYQTSMSKGALNNATAIGANASAMGNNATAIGANAQVSANNALVLGSINGVNGATASTFVGIGTTTPSAALDVLGETTVHTLIGNGGCGSSYAGIGFIGSGGFNSNCVNYALLGENNGNLYINSNGSGTISFRNQNNSSNLMTINASGDVTIKGNLSKGGGSFKIDDPLDPANKYLYHSFVESPDMMDIYNGVATLDSRGAVWITLPNYFEVLNRDFRYQLSSIGRPQPNLYVAREVAGNRFKISGGKPGAKVSWQVTGIRHDAYADAHRIPNEEEKPAPERGKYLHPELFGASEEQAVGYRPSSPSTAAAHTQVASEVSSRK